MSSRCGNLLRIEDCTGFRSNPVGLTKYALLALTIILAGAAIAGHYTHIGSTGIAVFRFSCLATGILFLMTCISQASCFSKKKISTPPSIKSPPLLSPLPHEAQESETSHSQENVMPLSKISSHEGEDDIKKDLQALVNVLPEDKITLFLSEIFDQSRYTLYWTCDILNQLDWGLKQELKDNALENILYGQIIKKRLISCVGGSLEIFDAQNKTISFSTHRLVLETEKLFGEGDFVEATPICDPLAKAIGRAFHEIARIFMSELKGTDNIDPKKRTGIQLEIGQTHACRFPASFIAPLLTYLCNIPGLIKLNLGDIGTPGPWEDADQNEPKQGLGPENFEALVQIVETNPYLLDAMFNLDRMTVDQQKSFMSHLEVDKKLGNVKKFMETLV